MRRLLLLFISFSICIAHMDTSSCGTTKKCIFVPAGCQEKNDCKQIFSYSTPDDSGWTTMELYSSMENPNNNYIAVGLSDDDSMGSDYVTSCAFVDGSQPEVHLTYNFGKSNAAPNEPQDVTMEKENLQLIHAHKDGEGMYCNFKQKTATTKSKFLPELNSEKIVFLARGNARKPRDLGIHSLDPASPDFPFISDQKVNVGAPQALTANATTNANAVPTPSSGGLSPQTRFFLVKLHATLMMIGWMVFVPVAILSARYLRDHFPKTQPCGLKMWFHFHRTLNFFGIPLVLLGTFLIFFAKDFSWRGPTASSSFETNTSPSSVHTLLGVIAVLLMLLQPIMALMRCAPEASARPVFNYTHRSVGIIAVIGAVIAILIGANSFKALWSDASWSFWIVVFYIVITILTVVIFEVLSHLKKQPSAKTIDMEMRNRMRNGYSDGPMPSGKIVEKKPIWAVTLLFILFVLFAVCVATALVILLFI